MVTLLRKYLSQFVSLSDEELEALMTEIQVVTYDKKVRLIEIGAVEQYLHFIVKGLARKFFYKGKDEVITQLAKEGELICSSVSFFSGNPSAYIVETIEPTTCYSLQKEKLEALYKRFPNMEKMSRLIITELFLQKEYWEIERIRHTTKERFVRFMEQNPDLFQRVPQKYLASYLNIKPETFSRLKHLLRNKKGEITPAK